MLWQDNHFLPGPSDAFLSYFNGNKEYERRFYSNFMTHFFDQVTGNNLKRRLQQHNLLQPQVVQATQTPASRAKTVRPIKGRKSRVAGEQRVVGKNLPRVNSVDLVTYMSISEVLVKTCSSNATTTKICQKLEVNKIGSSATRP